MSVLVRLALIAMACLPVMPGIAWAGICYNVTGLSEAAGLDITPLAGSPQGQFPVVGVAQGVCGLGEPAVAVQGTAIVDPSGAARLGIKLLASRAGCAGGEAELVLPSPFTTGAGQVRLPEGSVANVSLALDATGQACQLTSPRPAACVGNATTLCLQQNRFRVTATRGGTAQPVPGQILRVSGESGHASLNPDNIEVLIKVLNACAINNRYWVTTTAPTNVEYTLTVTDTATGAVKTYNNPAGRVSTTTQDTSAFATCP